MRPSSVAGAVAAAAALVLAGTVFAGATADDVPTGKATVLRVAARDHAFSLSRDTVPTGLVSIQLQNDGPSLHHIVLARLRDDATPEQYVDAMRSGIPGRAESMIDLVGGANEVIPGGYQETFQWLQEGRYVIACFVPLPDRTPHALKGMVASFEVVGRNKKMTKPAGVEGTIEAVDYGFRMPDVKRDATYRFYNDSQFVLHELAFLRLNDGATVSDAMGWFRDGARGTPPFVAVGGGGALAPGREHWLKVDFEPGNYVAYCRVPDGPGPTPHFVKGMLSTFTVT